MKKGGVFLDVWGQLRDGWAWFLYFLFAFVVIMVACLAIDQITPFNKELENRADYKAFCDSIGGSFGEAHCYKDGKVIFGGEE